MKIPSCLAVTVGCLLSTSAARVLNTPLSGGLSLHGNVASVIAAEAPPDKWTTVKNLAEAVEKLSSSIGNCSNADPEIARSLAKSLEKLTAVLESLASEKKSPTTEEGTTTISPTTTHVVVVTPPVKVLTTMETITVPPVVTVTEARSTITLPPTTTIHTIIRDPKDWTWPTTRTGSNGRMEWLETLYEPVTENGGGNTRG